VPNFSLRFVRGDQGGQAAVEFALVVPVLVLLVMGIVVFSNLYRDHNQLVGAVAAASRFEAICNGVTTAGANATAVGTAAAGNLSPAPSFSFNDLTTGNPAASTSSCGIPEGHQIQVTGTSNQSVNLYVWNFSVPLSNSVTVTEQ
jgi:Flp pilus assembly protein TadG